MSLSTALHNILSNRNYHPRDKYIEFFEEGHKYIIALEPDVRYTSVTTFIEDQFEKFNADEVIKKMMSGSKWQPGHKYWGMTPEQIKALWSNNSASAAGTELHFMIECFYNEPLLIHEYDNEDLLMLYMSDHGVELVSKPLEWQYFINFVRDNPQLKPYRTEWSVFNEDVKISGSIDMLYENYDGTLSIYDWKRCKEIVRTNSFNKFATNPCICQFPNSNFWHYAIQLNIYKYILESKYNKIVKELYLVRLHPDANEKNYELIKVPILSKEVRELMEERLKNINNNNDLKKA